MATFPALMIWTDAYLGDTHHLTTEEHGAYMLMLMTAWRSPGCCLRDDDVFLARVAKANVQRWRCRLRPAMIHFWDIHDGVWTQRRLLEERAKVEAISQKRSMASRKKWESQKRRKPLDGNDSGNANADAIGMQRARATPHPHPVDSETRPSSELPFCPELQNITPTQESKQTPGGVGQADLDTLLYQRGKALLGRKAGGQITKLRSAVGSVGAALQVIDDAQHKESPAEYVAGAIRTRNGGNGHAKQPEDWYGRRILDRALKRAEAEAEPCADLIELESRAPLRRGRADRG